MIFKARAEKLNLKIGNKLMIVQRHRDKLTSKDFMYEHVLEDIESNLTAPFTFQQVGIIEISNRIIIIDASAMAKWSNCPKSFSVPAMETLLYIRNCILLKAIRITTASFDSSRTSYELWGGQKYNIRYLPVWGCNIYIC